MHVESTDSDSDVDHDPGCSSFSQNYNVGQVM